MRNWGAVEQLLLDSYVILKPLHVAQPRHGAGHMTVDSRCAMRG
jgi:hypothetical protein